MFHGFSKSMSVQYEEIIIFDVGYKWFKSLARPDGNTEEDEDSPVS